MITQLLQRKILLNARAQDIIAFSQGICALHDVGNKC